MPQWLPLLFFYEGMAVKKEWRLSMTVVGLVTLVAAIHYDYMRDFWVAEQATPIVYRYIDWLITVPLLMIEFYIILKAVGASVSAGSFWRLLVGTLVMLIGSYLGEAQIVSALLGFIVGMIGWAIYPLGYVFGYMLGSVDDGSLNIIYNLADFVNKILFGLIIWSVATKNA